MGREHLQNSDVNRSHEPVGIPLTRPSGTLSPSEGERDGVRGFMRSKMPLTCGAQRLFEVRDTGLYGFAGAVF